MTALATTTTFALKCEAHATGRAASDWGFTTLPCNSRRGLRTFRDRNGEERYFCASLGHERNAKRRFGVAPASEACRFCGDTTAIVDGRYVLVAFPDALSVVCDNCVEKADER